MAFKSLMSTSLKLYYIFFIASSCKCYFKISLVLYYTLVISVSFSLLSSFLFNYTLHLCLNNLLNVIGLCTYLIISLNTHRQAGTISTNIERIIAPFYFVTATESILQHTHTKKDLKNLMMRNILHRLQNSQEDIWCVSE